VGLLAMSTFHQATYDALVSMGITENHARAAAKRYQQADAAVEWCFGAGADVSLSLSRTTYPHWPLEGFWS
jgi:hypothetical protein